MDHRSATERKGPLTPEAFSFFLSWLSPDQAQAAAKYLDLRKELVKLFIRKGCVHADELADRTLDRVVTIACVEPGKYASAISLCCGVARKVWLESLREKVHETLKDDGLAAPQLVDADFSEHEVQCLSSCLNKLSASDRELIVRYHEFQGRKKIEARKQLGNAHGGLNKVRIQAHRIRLRLHDCVTDCVQRSAYN
jgi:DNA-directed RNA polymerase specialized sigma24 family protein